MNEKIVIPEYAAELDALVIRDLDGDVAHIMNAHEVTHDLREVVDKLSDAVQRNPELTALALLTALNAGVDLNMSPASVQAASLESSFEHKTHVIDAAIARDNAGAFEYASFPMGISPVNAQKESGTATQKPASVTRSASEDTVDAVDVTLPAPRPTAAPSSRDADDMEDARRESKVMQREVSPGPQEIQNKYFSELGFPENNPYAPLIDKIFGAVSSEIAQEAKEVLRYYDTVTGKVTKENADFNPNAKNTNADNSIDRGLYQINDVHTLSDLITRFPKIALNLGITTPDALYDPETNIKVALWVMWQFHGWRAWYGAPEHLREKPRYEFSDEQISTIHDILYGFHYDPIPTVTDSTP